MKEEYTRLCREKNQLAAEQEQAKVKQLGLVTPAVSVYLYMCTARAGDPAVSVYLYMCTARAGDPRSVYLYMWIQCCFTY